MKRLSILLLLLLIMEDAAFGAEIIIPHIKVKPGETIDLPVIMDIADNLAGVKLVINYDKELLNFKEGNTTKHTRSLMLVINDKQPGRLIVVMAGARGISGKDMPLLTLTFVVKKDLPGARSTRLEILENQLMSEQLKEIKAVINIKPIDIAP